MVALWGDDVASEVRERKLSMPELRAAEVRPHPEAPDREDWSFSTPH